MFPKKKIINFKNFFQKQQGFYVIFSENEVPKLKVEQVLYYLFKEPENETQFPYIQYIDKTQQIVLFEDLISQNSYYLHLSMGSNKCFNYDAEEAKESIKNNLVTVLKEEEFMKSMDLTNILALKERINALEGLIEGNYEKAEHKYKEMIGFMMDYRMKLEKQNSLYKEENLVLEKVEKEARMISDQFEKTRVALEKNVFFYNKSGGAS